MPAKVRGVRSSVDVNCVAVPGKTTESPLDGGVPIQFAPLLQRVFTPPPDHTCTAASVAIGLNKTRAEQRDKTFVFILTSNRLLSNNYFNVKEVA
jgi:hypothetical protein